MRSLQCALVLLVKRSSWGPDGEENTGLSSLAPQNLPWQQVCWKENWMASPSPPHYPALNLNPSPYLLVPQNSAQCLRAPLIPPPNSLYLPLVPGLLHVQWLPCLPFYPRLQVLSVPDGICLVYLTFFQTRGQAPGQPHSTAATWKSAL